ncbi:MAG: ABC transporter ATP-binding protein/permease [Bdellovibrionaceae bacterium]|nr:ABC transporter ATP-binding protein/permease [Pseudobdellovibrionaceae bacterium]
MNKPKTGNDLRSYFLFMWSYLKNYQITVFLLIFTVVVFVIAGRLIPIVFGWAIDFGMNEKDLSKIYFYAVILLACNLVRGILSFVCSYGFRYLGQKTLFSIRKDLVDHIHRLPMKFFDKTDSGRIVTRISNDTRSLGDLFSEGFAGILINLIEIASILISLFWVAWPLALIVLLTFPPVLWMTHLLSEQIRKKYIVIKSKLSSINTFSAESLDGIQVLQLYGGEEKAQQHFAKEVEDYKNLQLEAHVLFAKLWPILEMFQVACIILSIAFGLLMINHQMLTVGDISAFILLLQGFFRPLRYILEKYNQVQNGVTSSQRIIGLLQEGTESPLAIVEVSPTSTASLTLKSQLSRIPAQHTILEAKDLSFSYLGSTNAPTATSTNTQFSNAKDRNSGKPTLHSLNFKINSGQKVALVGRTGSGKTTLVSLLQRFYQPQDQTLFLAGQDINSFDLLELRRNIVVLRQEEFLFKGTIRSNILLGNVVANDAKVEEIRQRAFIKQSLDAPVEEMGSNLSAGEKQLIALARVLLFDPSIVILDEATSHIDSVLEKQVLAAMNQVLHGRTSIVIAHRLSTVMNSDLVIVLKDGEIVEMGPPEYLLENKSGDFSSFFDELL